jgi:predicted short-subunit dehydrogenase-like oxidoreductase (DUF2520 family)
MRYVVVGPGKVGTALARLLHQAGHEFLGAVGRTLESARACCQFATAGRPTTDPTELVPGAEFVFLTLPDDRIEAVCGQIAAEGAFRAQAVVVHCSGALPSTVLNSAQEAGARIASMHPLQTFAEPAQAVQSVAGAYCCVEGGPSALPSVTALAESIGLRPLTVSAEAKALYHAAAVMACNYLVALEDMAGELMEASGIARPKALEALLPLVRTTVDNLGARGVHGALTGPIARGDADTVRGHLEALAERTPDLLPAYRLLGLRALQLAQQRDSLPPETVEQLQQMLQ